VAATIKKATGIDAELIEGRRGEFTVWVQDTLVAEKDPDLGFPTDEEIVAAVQAALQ
jgi:hypothetical protein